MLWSGSGGFCPFRYYASRIKLYTLVDDRQRMVAVTTRRLWLTFSSCLVAGVVFCLGLYFLAIRGGVSTGLAALWAGATFVVFIVALGLGALRMLRNPEWNAWSNPPEPSTGLVFWMATGVVVPALAFVLHLGISFIVAVVLATIQAAGLPVARIVEPVSWIAAAVSLGCASAAWWLIWEQYKDSLKR